MEELVNKTHRCTKTLFYLGLGVDSHILFPGLFYELAHPARPLQRCDLFWRPGEVEGQVAGNSRGEEGVGSQEEAEGAVIMKRKWLYCSIVLECASNLGSSRSVLIRRLVSHFRGRGGFVLYSGLHLIQSPLGSVWLERDWPYLRCSDCFIIIATFGCAAVPDKNKLTRRKMREGVRIHPNLVLSI